MTDDEEPTAREKRSGFFDITWSEPKSVSLAAAGAVAEIGRVYAGREIGGASWAEVEALTAHVTAYGTDPALYPGAHPDSSDGRALRLRLAAYADLATLQAEAEGSQLAPEMANAAILLGWHLRDYDARHRTGAAVHPAPDDLYWEAPGLARAYTRAAWLSLYSEAR